MTSTPRRAGAILVLAAGIFAAGCAIRANVPELPDDHPANPAAPSSPYTRPSGLLGPAAAAAVELPGTAGDHAHPPGHGAPDAGPAPHYACPMHPEVRSDEPGSCPECGMDLEPVEPGPPNEGVRDHGSDATRERR